MFVTFFASSFRHTWESLGQTPDMILMQTSLYHVNVLHMKCMLFAVKIAAFAVLHDPIQKTAKH